MRILKNANTASEFLYHAGCRYWTASILPVVAGTTLPFWLRPRGFSFKWIAAIEFLAAAVFFHGGFSLLQSSAQNRITLSRPEHRLAAYGCICIAAACLLGLHLNSRLVLQPGVHKYIFIVYGLTALFAGALYVLPPFSFYRRAGGEVILAEGLGMIPLLGAYLIQAGDLTRKVYLISLPLVVVTGLWIWIDELAGRIDDENAGRKTMVMEFGPAFSGRYGVSALAGLVVLTILLVLVSGSVHPAALVSLVSVGTLLKIVSVSWNEYGVTERMADMRTYAFMLHLAVGSILAVSSLAALFMPDVHLG